MILAVALVFVGNHAFTADQLRAAMVTREGESFDTSRDVDDESFQIGLLELSAFYWDRGYANAKIGTPEVTADAVMIPIDEGPKFTISKVTVSGEILESVRTHVAMIHVRPTMTFSRTMLVDDLGKLQDYYEDRGYAYANVIPHTRIDSEHTTIAVDFEVTRGERSYIEAIEVYAPTKERAAQLRHALPMAVGDLYTNADLVETKRRATRMGTEVTVAKMHGSTPTSVKITVEVLGSPDN